MFPSSFRFVLSYVVGWFGHWSQARMKKYVITQLLSIRMYSGKTKSPSIQNGNGRKENRPTRSGSETKKKTEQNLSFRKQNRAPPKPWLQTHEHMYKFFKLPGQKQNVRTNESETSTPFFPTTVPPFSQVSASPLLLPETFHKRSITHFHIDREVTNQNAPSPFSQTSLLPFML